jgi:hypothetical protein
MNLHLRLPAADHADLTDTHSTLATLLFAERALIDTVTGSLRLYT